MMILGWAMTVGGLGLVLFWTIWEAATTFSSAPVITLVGVVVVLAVLALLVPIPLLIATRRAGRSRVRSQPS